MSLNPANRSIESSTTDSNVKSNQSHSQIKNEPHQQFLIVLSPEKPLISSKVIKLEIKEEAFDDLSTHSENSQLSQPISSTIQTM